MKKIVNIFWLFLLYVSSLTGVNPGSWYVTSVPSSTTTISIEASGKMRLQTTVANGNATHKLPALAQGTYQLQFTASIITAVQPKIAVYNLAGLLVAEQVLTEGINSITFNSDGGAGVFKIYEAAYSLASPTLIDIDNYTLSAVQVLEEKAVDKEKTSERALASKEFELSNHLGNVLAVVSDKKLGVANAANTTIDYYKADVQSANDYYAFGSMMNGRKYTGGGYRYGFNGKEKDDELKGEGNSLDFGARMYDSRIGRWLSVDPLQEKYPGFSVYNFTMDNPILYIDPNGKEVTIKDVEIYKAILGGLTAKEINRIHVNKDGKIIISGKAPGSKNFENLRTLVNSKKDHVLFISNTYESAAGPVKLRKRTFARTLFPENETKGTKVPTTMNSPDDNVYIVFQPNLKESDLVLHVSHEVYGHGVLGEMKRTGSDVNPIHDYIEIKDKKGKVVKTEEQNEDFKQQAWPANKEAKANYKINSNDTKWNKALDKKVQEFKEITSKESNFQPVGITEKL